MLASVSLFSSASERMNEWTERDFLKISFASSVSPFSSCLCQFLKQIHKTLSYEQIFHSSWNIFDLLSILINQPPLNWVNLKSISISHPLSLLTPQPIQTWGHRWRGGCAGCCLWVSVRWALHSGCGRPRVAADSWCHGTEVAGWELAGAATAQCCPLLEKSTDRKERSRAFRANVLGMENTKNKNFPIHLLRIKAFTHRGLLLLLKNDVILRSIFTSFHTANKAIN